GRHLRPPGPLLVLLSARDLHHPEYHPHADSHVVQAVTTLSRLPLTDAASERASGGRRWGGGPHADWIMTLKTANGIKRMALEHRMIEPFVDEQMRVGVISYGLSSYGYDIRVADDFKVFTNVYNTVVDPKSFDSRSFVDIKTDVCIIPPNSFALAR